MERKIREISAKISDITDQHLGPRVEEDTWLEEKHRLEAQLEQLTVEYAPQKAKMDELTLQLEEMGKDIQETERMYAEFDTKLDEARNRVQELRDKLSRLESIRSDKAATLMELKQRTESQKSVFEEKKALVESLIEAGGERINTRKTREQVLEEISRLNAQREVSTQITETREEIMAEVAILEDKVNELNAECDLGRETLRVVSVY